MWWVPWGRCCPAAFSAWRRCPSVTPAPWPEVEAPEGLDINLDGEPLESRHLRFAARPGALRVHLPDSSRRCSAVALTGYLRHDGLRPLITAFLNNWPIAARLDSNMRKIRWPAFSIRWISAPNWWARTAWRSSCSAWRGVPAVRHQRVQGAGSPAAAQATLMPHRHLYVCGVVNLRGQTLPVIDLSQAIGMRPLTPNENSTIIVTGTTARCGPSWSAVWIASLSTSTGIHPAAAGWSGRQHHLTAVTKVDDQIVEIIDVEKVLSEIAPMSTKVSDEKLADRCWPRRSAARCCWWMTPAWPQTSCARPCPSWGCVHSASDGLKALQLLKKWADSGGVMTDKLLMIFTDAEMPEMDGYRLTTEIRNDPRLKDLYGCCTPRCPAVSTRPW